MIEGDADIAYAALMALKEAYRNQAQRLLRQLESANRELGALRMAMRGWLVTEDDGTGDIIYPGQTGAEVVYPRAYADHIARLETALQSIAKNTCCDNCQEAARVARAALASYVGLATEFGGSSTRLATKSAPVPGAPHNSGERDPSVMPDYAGAEPSRTKWVPERFLTKNDIAAANTVEQAALARWPMQTAEHRAMRAAYCDGAATTPLNLSGVKEVISEIQVILADQTKDDATIYLRQSDLKHWAAALNQHIATPEKASPPTAAVGPNWPPHGGQAATTFCKIDKS